MLLLEQIIFYMGEHPLPTVHLQVGEAIHSAFLNLVHDERGCRGGVLRGDFRRGGVLRGDFRRGGVR